MTFSRRQFLGSAVPFGAVALSAYAGAPAAMLKGDKPVSSPGDAASIDSAVVLFGDNVPQPPQDYLARLQELLRTNDKPADMYLKDGAVGELEAKFSALLGKEDTVFMPTGTLANQVALRLLCGEARHALVQQESHLYRDEADAASTLSGINMVPMAPGKAAPTFDEVRAAIDRAEIGPYPIKVGAISLESPVRRADGATVPIGLIEEVSKLAHSKGIGMHLDGARLLLMSGLEGFEVKAYCEPFDTVYVSLYKYLGAPFGGVLSGPRALMAKARDLRHIFGGTILHGWQPALLAANTLEGFEARFALARKAGEQLLERLGKTSGFKVHRVEQGSNIAFLEVSAKRQEGLGERMKKANVMIAGFHEGKLQIAFNETLLRRTTDDLMAAFTGG
jgi:threonine aldolase